MTFREETLKRIGIFPGSVLLELEFEFEKKFDGYTGYVISYNVEENERVRSILMVPDNGGGGSADALLSVSMV